MPLSSPISVVCMWGVCGYGRGREGGEFHTLYYTILWYLAETPCVEEMLLHTYQHTHKESLKADPLAHTFSQASHVSAMLSKWDPLPGECERGRSLLEAGGRLGAGEAATSLSAVWTCYYGWRWQGAGMSYVCMCVSENLCIYVHQTTSRWYIGRRLYNKDSPYTITKNKGLFDLPNARDWLL